MLSTGEMKMSEATTISETMKAMILYSLRTHPKVKITFTKKDGTERVMNCTLSESVLPAREPDSEVKPHSPDVQPVWDVDAGGWRSFRWDSVIAFDAIQRKENQDD
jgi:hypothetical protein